MNLKKTTVELPLILCFISYISKALSFVISNPNFGATFKIFGEISLKLATAKNSTFFLTNSLLLIEFDVSHQNIRELLKSHLT